MRFIQNCILFIQVRPTAAWPGVYHHSFEVASISNNKRRRSLLNRNMILASDYSRGRRKGEEGGEENGGYSYGEDNKRGDGDPYSMKPSSAGLPSNFAAAVPTDPIYYGTTGSGSNEADGVDSLIAAGVVASMSSSKRMNMVTTLGRYLSDIVQEDPEFREMEGLLLAIQMACKSISNLVNRASINQFLSNNAASTSDSGNSKLMDVSTNVLRNALRYTGRLEEISGPQTKGQFDKPVLIESAIDSRYTICFNPLDGSNNADASICSGTIFGVFEDPQHAEDSATKEEGMMLRAGRDLVASGYCLYSSATILVFTVGSGTHGFTLDPITSEFVLTHPHMRIPDRGAIYSFNDGNSDGWDDSVRQYVKDMRCGNNQTKMRYTSRYVGSLVGDLHRTLCHGGIFGYPEDGSLHPGGKLHLLYECAPMSFLLEQAGGRSTTGHADVLEIVPDEVQTRTPYFAGSPEDIEELQSYLHC